ncbi:hypothetical protein [Limnoglobus roseus]|uniref:Uncharacterized protein n=1 Tax=Limnoglobus roseus TaxID=2598579 RepID=A0A5C1A521_9BACT|nr:hypothetical protein [Limnoglobus roseus]QEL13497.1 hypothetical protein PX52LOC_00354 [Limnoglobus roseus]
MIASIRLRAWLPVVVFVLSVGGTLALAQPPGFPNSPSFPTPPPIPPTPTFPTPTFPPRADPPAVPNTPVFPNAGMAEQGRVATPRLGSPAGGTPNAGMNGGAEWECDKCKHKWADSSGRTPERCPNCKTVFNEVVNADGTKTKTAAGRQSMYIGIAVLAIAVIAAIIKGIISMSSSPPPRKKKKKVRRPRDDDDDY